MMVVCVAVCMLPWRGEGEAREGGGHGRNSLCFRTNDAVAWCATLPVWLCVSMSMCDIVVWCVGHDEFLLLLSSEFSLFFDAFARACS